MAVKKKKKIAKKIVKKAVTVKKTAAKRSAVKPIKKTPKKLVKKKANRSTKETIKKKIAKAGPRRAVKKTASVKVKKLVTTVKKSTPTKTVIKIVTPKKPVPAREQEQTVVRVSAAKSQAQKSEAPITMRPKKQPMTTHTDVLTKEQAAIQETASTKPTTLLGALEFKPYQPAVDEAYMNDRQREHFRGILNTWKQQLMQDVDTTVGHLKEEAVFYADPVDRASQEEGFNLELRTRDRERRLIKKIEQSLDLLNKNDYGYCEDCSAEIGIRRLEARPTAVKCIDCKTFQEIREKQLGGG